MVWYVGGIAIGVVLIAVLVILGVRKLSSSGGKPNSPSHKPSSTRRKANSRRRKAR